MTIETRLARLEARVTRSTLVPAVSVIAPVGSGWRLDFGLVGAKPGSGKNLSSAHASTEAAETAYNMLLTRYPAGRDTESVLIVLDV